MVDILIFSSEISFLNFFTSSIVWHLFCITKGQNHTHYGWAENFPQFRDQLSCELARAAFPDLLFHTEPSLPGSCSYPRNGIDWSNINCENTKHVFKLIICEFWEYQTTGKLFCLCLPYPQHLTPIPKLQLASAMYKEDTNQVLPDISGGQQSPRAKHGTAGKINLD